ncbi:MAG: hypothetical protein F4003_10065 [Acidimicrobiaceae bacterium]|nr:hypothetical protein [Acidimicrobiaceae bacterium]MYC43632.1 hypothetical protein [Acidimicrobiaceae bacterium]
MIPTTALTNSSGLLERLELARRFHIHTILTCHNPQNVNLSQNTNINESIVVLRRHLGEVSPATRIIALDRLPTDDSETDQLFKDLCECETGTLADGWGDVSTWPAERIQAGDWAAAVWRSPKLAQGAARFAEHGALGQLAAAGLSAHATGQQLRGAFGPSAAGHVNAFPILKSKSADAQKTIRSTPDEHWAPKGKRKQESLAMLEKAGRLLITAGQDTSTGRVTSVADDQAYVGNGWMPLTGASPRGAKAAAVFLNSTVGRLLLMRNPGKKLNFPSYSADAASELPIPDIGDQHVQTTLADCWEATRSEIVPQFRDGYTDIRRRWDQAVCDALGWDISKIAELGELLAKEPHVRGVAYGQWKS